MAGRMPSGKRELSQPLRLIFLSFLHPRTRHENAARAERPRPTVYLPLSSSSNVLTQLARVCLPLSLDVLAQLGFSLAVAV
jgi:hypothetical protein